MRAASTGADNSSRAAVSTAARLGTVSDGICRKGRREPRRSLSDLCPEFTVWPVEASDRVSVAELPAPATSREDAGIAGDAPSRAGVVSFGGASGGRRIRLGSFGRNCGIGPRVRSNGR
jgi:hypothetical protein